MKLIVHRNIFLPIFVHSPKIMTVKNAHNLLLLVQKVNCRFKKHKQIYVTKTSSRKNAQLRSMV